MVTWFWAILYARKNETDGFISDDTLEDLPKPANRVDYAERLASDAVQLFKRVEGGWKILRYEEWNETKREIKDRRTQTKVRVQKHRIGNALHGALHVPQDGVTAAVTSAVTEGAGNAPCNGLVPDSLSLSSSPSLSSPLLLLSAQPVQVREPSAPQPVSSGEVLTQERRDIAKMLAIQDIDRVWAKFLGKAAEWGKRTSSVTGSWQAFCASEVPIQRVERERERAAAAQSAARAPKEPPARKVIEPLRRADPASGVHAVAVPANDGTGKAGGE